jgi:hypothetical protein
MNKKIQAAVAVLLATGGTAMAQTGPIRPSYEFPGTPTQASQAMGTMQMGDSPVFFAPWVTLAGGHDDNLFYSNTNKKSTAFYVISPGFKLEARSPSSVIQSSYQAGIGQYKDSEDDDYVDHQLRNSLDFLATRETAVRLGYDYMRLHDPRGSTDRPISGRPDRYKLSAVNGIVAIGQAGAPGRIELYGSNTVKSYLNNRAVTQFADRTVGEYGGAFYWRVFPKTNVLAEVRHTNVDYKINSPLTGEEERYYGGITWEATAATTGTIKVGELKKRFDSGLPGFKGKSWEALITWLPRTYSKFDLFTYRQPVESSGLGTFILQEAWGATWSHAWSSQFTTELNAKKQKDYYQQFSRTDDTTLLGGKVGYKFRRWLTLGAEYQHSNRDSNSSANEYDKNLWLLTVSATL